MPGKIILSIVFVLLAFIGPAQIDMDSLEQSTESLARDTSGIYYLERLSEKLRTKDQRASIWLSEKAVEFAQSTTNAKLLAEVNCNAGIRNMSAGNYLRASTFLVKAEKIAEENNLPAALMKVFNSLGNLYALQQQHSTAILYYKKAAQICEELKRNADAAVIIGNIGNIYYFRSEANRKLLDSALFFYKKALSIQTQVKDTLRMIGMLNNLGLIYTDKGQYDSASSVLVQARELIDASHDRLDLLYNLQYLGRLEFERENYKEAIELYQKSLAIAEEMNEVQFIGENHFSLSRAYEGLKDFENAFKHFKKYKDLSDSLLNSENFEKIAGMQNQYEEEKRQKQIEIFKVNENRNKIIIYASVIGLVLLLLVTLLLFNRNRTKARTNKILEEQNNLISEKNKDITDSINYAKRIQHAILPGQETLEKVVGKNFVLFFPRDIVSGDFYWAIEKNGKRIVAVADCTGHGVPGSMMSMIGNDLLNQAVVVHEVTSPEKIIEELRKGIIHALRQSESSDSTKDGMDISVCVFYEENGEECMDFSGANNSVYHIHDATLNEIEADHFPAGISSGELKSFTKKTVRLKKGDMIYLLTDGFPDQFGGPKGKKFKYSLLKKTLLDIHKMPVEQQHARLEEVFTNWKGSLDQIDDVTLMGIKVE